MTLGNAWHQMPGKPQGGLGRTLAGRGEAASVGVSDEARPARHEQTDWCGRRLEFVFFQPV